MWAYMYCVLYVFFLVDVFLCKDFFLLGWFVTMDSFLGIEQSWLKNHLQGALPFSCWITLGGIPVVPVTNMLDFVGK